MRVRSFRTMIPSLVLAAACASSPTSPGPRFPVFPAADSVYAEPLAGGVTWTRVHDPTGPWAVHVLAIDRERCQPRLKAAKAGPPFSSRATTSSLGRDALAAINADFFEIPSGMTVGPHVTGGIVWIGPGERPVLAFTSQGPVQGTAAIAGWIAHRADTADVAQVNRRKDTRPLPGVRLFTFGADTDSLPAALRLRGVDGDGRMGWGIVAALPVSEPGPPAPDELLVTGDAAWIGRRALGDTVAWSMALRVDGQNLPALEAVGGFPTLIRNRRNVLAEQPGVRPDFGERRHPRTAVGWNDRSLFWVVVDGRQMPYSDGMSLPELTDLFLRLGATEAINLDGGGSTAMTLRGRIANRPSDAQGERAVGNALLLESCTRL
jgi:hypothetical protein